MVGRQIFNIDQKFKVQFKEMKDYTSSKKQKNIVKIR